MGNVSSEYFKNINTEYPENKIIQFYKLTHYFSDEHYDIRKFTSEIKKPSTIKFLQGTFYLSILHYLVFSSIWLSYFQIQQLFHAINWLKLIKQSKMDNSVILVLKRNKKKKKPIFSRIRSTSYLYDMDSVKLKRTSTMKNVKNMKNINIDDEEESIPDAIKGSYKFYVLFDEIPIRKFEIDSVYYYKSPTPYELLEEIYKKKDSIPVHEDFERSYSFLLKELISY